jgi:hypothetical protein
MKEYRRGEEKIMKKRRGEELENETKYERGVPFFA